jgi:hypothetical protein
LKDVLVNGVLEVGAEGEPQSIEALSLIVLLDVKDREQVHLLEGVALGDPHIDDGVEVIRVGLHERFLAEAVFFNCRFS